MQLQPIADQCVQCKVLVMHYHCQLKCTKLVKGMVTLAHCVIQTRRCQNYLFTLNKPGRFIFPTFFKHSDSMRNNTAFSWSIIKSSPRVWIWKYSYFKWGAKLHLSGFGIFIFLYTVFQAFRSWKDVFANFNLNLWKTWWKIQKSAKCFLPPGSNLVYFQKGLNPLFIVLRKL